MPLNACGWSTEEDEQLADLVQPHSYLYNVQDPSRKNILARETRWQEIAENLSKPVEECKKRWRGLRDGYMRSKRLGTTKHKSKAGVFEKLQYLDGTSLEADEEDAVVMEMNPMQECEEIETEQKVITDKQEYYEITVVEPSNIQSNKPKYIKILPKTSPSEQAEGKIKKNRGGRRKALPVTTCNIPPIKILPKPIVMNGPKLVHYVEDTKVPEQRSQVIEKLIEKVLKENTNEVDVFFRSMAASVKKLQPNLIPKVKMEVCSIVAKYEMQSFDKSGHH